MQIPAHQPVAAHFQRELGFLDDLDAVLGAPGNALHDREHVALSFFSENLDGVQLGFRRDADHAFAVQRRVVDFREKARHQLASLGFRQLDAVKNIKRPQRKAAVKQLAVELRAQLVHLRQRHGRGPFFGRVGAADMKTDVHRVGLYPQRMAQVQRHEHQLAAEHRGQVHALGKLRHCVERKVQHTRAKPYLFGECRREHQRIERIKHMLVMLGPWLTDHRYVSVAETLTQCRRCGH